MSNHTRKGGKKNRKHGRNKIACQTYRTAGTREKNKARNALRHFKRYGGTDPRVR